MHDTAQKQKKKNYLSVKNVNAIVRVWPRVIMRMCCSTGLLHAAALMCGNVSAAVFNPRFVYVPCCYLLFHLLMRIKNQTALFLFFNQSGLKEVSNRLHRKMWSDSCESSETNWWCKLTVKTVTEQLVIWYIHKWVNGKVSYNSIKRQLQVIIISATWFIHTNRRAVFKKYIFFT